MEPEVDRDPNIFAGVCKRAVNCLPVADHYIAGRTDEGYRFRQAIRTRRLHHRLDIRFAVPMGPRHDPQPIGRVTTVQLCHEVEAVSALVEARTVPMGPAVLMPGHGTAQSRLLDPDR